MKWQHGPKEITEAEAVSLLSRDFPNATAMLEIARSLCLPGYVILKNGTHLTYSPGGKQ